MADMEFLEKSILRRVAVKLITVGAAFLVAKVNGHMGIAIDQTQFLAGVYLGLDILRHDLVLRWPGLAPWVS
jgi:hypothetical protein